MYRVSLKSEFCKLSTEIVDHASKLVREVFSSMQCEWFEGRKAAQCSKNETDLTFEDKVWKKECEKVIDLANRSK